MLKAKALVLAGLMAGLIQLGLTNPHYLPDELPYQVEYEDLAYDDSFTVLKEPMFGPIPTIRQLPKFKTNTEKQIHFLFLYLKAIKIKEAVCINFATYACNVVKKVIRDVEVILDSDLTSGTATIEFQEKM